MNIEKKTPIDAGVGKIAKNVFKKFIDKLTEKEDGVLFELLPPSEDAKGNNGPEGYIYLIKVEEVEDGVYNVYVQHKVTKEERSMKAVKLDEDSEKGFTNALGKVAAKIIKDMDSAVEDDSDGETFADIKYVESASTLKVTLQKVTSANSIDVNLVNIYSDYAAPATYELVQQFVADDAVIDALPENTPVTYAIDAPWCTEGADIQYNICEPCTDIGFDTIKNAIYTMMSSLLKLKATMDYVNWNSAGVSAPQLSSQCDSMAWKIDSQINQLGVMAVRLLGEAPHPVSLCQAMPVQTDDALASKFTVITGFNALIAAMSEVITTMNLYWCDFDHSDQHMIDEWISTWRVESEYLLARQVI